MSSLREAWVGVMGFGECGFDRVSLPSIACQTQRPSVGQCFDLWPSSMCGMLASNRGNVVLRVNAVFSSYIMVVCLSSYVDFL